MCINFFINCFFYNCNLYMKYTEEQKEKLKKYNADRFLTGTKNTLIKNDKIIYQSKLNK